jgi:hypothetical protein
LKRGGRLRAALSPFSQKCVNIGGVAVNSNNGHRQAW